MRNFIDIVESQRLDEISRPDHMGAAKEILNRAGWDVFSTDGAFSNIYEKPGVDYILKIYASIDTAYEQFIHMVKQNPNPHFPRIIGSPIKVLKNDVVGYNAVRLEKLTPWWGKIENIGVKIDLIKTYINGRDDIWPDKINNFAWDRFVTAKNYMTIHPELGTAVDLIMELMSRPKIRLDLHGDNVMMRGDTLVIIDPVAPSN
jgi:hypothetical protein